MTASWGEQRLRQLVDGTFVGPLMPRDGQPSVAVVPMDWNAYDTPRLWDALRREADELAWLQARGFENLAQLLLVQHDFLKRLRDALADSWDSQISPSAVHFFSFLDGLIAALADDAVAHARTSRGLDGILAALAAARDQIDGLKQQWDSVTTDWVPDWWDREADNLNVRARQIVSATDKAVGDHREQITVARLFAYPASVGHIQPAVTQSEPRGRIEDTGGGPVSPSPTQQTRTTASPPPPVPGLNPVPAQSPELQGMSGVPRTVPAVPGSPVSVLPVPPGNPFAPGGGAYVLPGPGVGRGGWIHPMPAGPAAPSAPAGLMPAPAPGAGGQPGHEPRRGRRDRVWEVAQGVPPVIGGEESAPAQPAEPPQADHDQAFLSWFADVATPWSADLTANLPPSRGPRR